MCEIEYGLPSNRDPNPKPPTPREAIPCCSLFFLLVLENLCRLPVPPTDRPRELTPFALVLVGGGCNNNPSSSTKNICIKKRPMDRAIPGVTVDQSATLALRSLLMGGGGGGSSSTAGDGGGGGAGGDGEASRFWSSGGSSAEGGAGGAAGAVRSAAALPRCVCVCVRTRAHVFSPICASCIMSHLSVSPEKERVFRGAACVRTNPPLLLPQFFVKLWDRGGGARGAEGGGRTRCCWMDAVPERGW